VGTINGAVEDTDVAIRAFARAKRSAFLDASVVGHRDPDPALRSRYYRGSLVALSRHARKVKAVPMELARKIAIGLYLVGRGELRLKDYFAALRAAREFFAST
jgi:hypothetical protein